MGCDGDLVKCLVFWTNLLLALVGISLLSVGVVYKVNLEEVYYVIPEEYHSITVIPVLLIPMGTTLIALAILGCYGTLTERIRFVIIQSIVLIVIFAIQISVGANAFYEIRDEESFVKKLNHTLDHVFAQYGRHEYKEVVDLIQHKLKCCGINGPSFWQEVPKSCNHKNFIDDENDIPGCPPFVKDYLFESVNIVGTTTIAFAGTEIVAAFISFYFVKFLRNQSRRFVYMKSLPPENDIL